ncbi:MAG TPA: MaoC family dehydratase [Albitalea sp.]|uniref:MaoC family dehydratase n=1 Tax=Piscinibacter sp. TaxID=1903157 RepID=UPI002ED0E66D
MTLHTSAQSEPLLYWEDFREGEVREFGEMQVNHDDIVRFASEFDPQPFHLDDEAGRRSLFGGLVASGWHTVAMAMRMMCDGYLLHSASLGSPGIESLKWLRPVRPGDTLRVRMTVLEARPLKSKPDVGLTKSRTEVLNQAGEVVMEMHGMGMFRRRP